ncbi:BQ2448_5434 [Microbotryum intermedium]|uniref:BQ2448_5434 protein n=1 Tax=Microbotryum intermedium TaxID=269621 RepID=A0A238F731_9BASI|nr:BQ2448_5434 [Microbotryum intermedium]
MHSARHYLTAATLLGLLFALGLARHQDVSSQHHSHNTKRSYFEHVLTSRHSSRHCKMRKHDKHCYPDKKGQDQDQDHNHDGGDKKGPSQKGYPKPKNQGEEPHRKRRHKYPADEKEEDEHKSSPKQHHTQEKGKSKDKDDHHPGQHGDDEGKGCTPRSSHHTKKPHKKQKQKQKKKPETPVGSTPPRDKGDQGKSGDGTDPGKGSTTKPGPKSSRIPVGSGSPPKKPDPSTPDPSTPPSEAPKPPSTKTPSKSGKVITTYTGSMTGNATFYAVDDDGKGNCLLPRRTDRMFAAINDHGWAGSSQCGMCVCVSTLDGTRSVTVMITNREPTKEEGALDLSEKAFTALAERQVGRLMVKWTPADCQEAHLATGTPSVVWKSGSTKDWFAVQVRDSALPISQISIRITSPAGTTTSSTDKDRPWNKLQRTDYNFFVADHGIVDDKQGKIEGPFDLLVEYQNETQVVLNNIALTSKVLHQP